MRIRNQKSEIRNQRLGGRFYFICFMISIFYLLSSASILFAENNSLEELYQNNMAESEEMFVKLQAWKNVRDWDNFYAHKRAYRYNIESLLAEIAQAPFELRLKASYLAFKLRDLIDHKSKDKAFNDFLGQVQTIDKADKDMLSFLRSTITDLSPKEKIKLKRRMVRSYSKILKRSSSRQLLSQEAESFYNSGDLDNYVKLAQDYLSVIDSSQDLRLETLRLIKKSCAGGFNKNSTPYFGEELFKSFVASGGVLTEDLQYLRGYNLEQAFEYRRAQETYQDFLDKFPESLLFDQVAFRAGYLSLYKLGQLGQAQQYFSKIKDETYALARHLKIADRQGLGGEESYNYKSFLSAFLGKEDKPNQGSLGIKSDPIGVFTDSRLSIDSVSFNPRVSGSSGQGIFLWSGDLGSVNISTSTPSVATSFKNSGFKVINLVEKSKEGVLGFGTGLITVYKVKVSPEDNKSYPKQEVNFRVKIEPYLPFSFVKFYWEVTKDGEVILGSDRSEFVQSFEHSGRYNLRLKLFFLGQEVYAQESSFSVFN